MGLAFLISDESLQVMTDRKVLKESEYKSFLDASAVVDSARQEARRIVRQGVQQIDDARRQGYLDGLAEARSEYSQRLLNDAVDSARQLQALRTSMAGIVVKAVNQLLTSADPRALLEAALLKVDTLIRNEPFVTMWVAPASEASLRAALDHLRTEAGWTIEASVMTDAGVAPGSCVVQTASGSVEIGLDAQLAAVRKAVERVGLVGHG